MKSTDGSASGRRWSELLGRDSGSRWPVSPDDWEAEAARILPVGPRGYIFDAAGSGATRDANRDAFDRVRLVPRMLATPPTRDLSVTLFEHRLESPLLIAPVGVLTIAHPSGDLGMAEAAQKLGVPMVVSTAGSTPLETIAATAPDLVSWFQLYWVKDRDVTQSLVARAEKAGCTALVLTVDTPMLGWRVTDLANSYSPFTSGHGIAHFVSDPVFRSLIDFDPDQEPGRAGDEMTKLFVNPGLTWADVAWLRELTSLPVLIKGILHPDDARKALDTGFDGIIVSNHGGRQIDGSVATLDALPAVRAAVPAHVPVLIDGGIRRGSDVIKAAALGADAVLVGRLVTAGLAVGGAHGVHEVLANLLAEVDSVLALCGYESFADLDTSILHVTTGQPT